MLLKAQTYNNYLTGAVIAPTNILLCTRFDLDYFKFQGIDSDEPVLQIGNYTFTGEFKGEISLMCTVTVSY